MRLAKVSIVVTSAAPTVVEQTPSRTSRPSVTAAAVICAKPSASRSTAPLTALRSPTMVAARGTSGTRAACALPHEDVNPAADEGFVKNAARSGARRREDLLQSCASPSEDGMPQRFARLRRKWSVRKPTLSLALLGMQGSHTGPQRGRILERKSYPRRQTRASSMQVPRRLACRVRHRSRAPSAQPDSRAFHAQRVPSRGLRTRR